LTTLVSFDVTNGASPRAGLVRGSDGNFYGTTPQAFSTNVRGTVFKMTPVLTAVSDGGEFLLSWPTNDVGWTLQTTTDLALSNWSDAAELPALVAGRHVITNGMTNAIQFFRLQRSQ